MRIADPTPPHCAAFTGIPVGTGYCKCGCGEKAPLAKKTQRSQGAIAGQPQRHIRNHDKRRWNSYLVDPETLCWDLQVVPKGGGYKDIKFGGQRVPAHRAFYERHRGPIPEGLDLDHLCRNRGCVNPDHLEPVTHAENVRRGAKTKLTPAQVAAIRVSPLSRSAAARQHGVSASQVKKIRRGESWKETS